MAESGCDDRSRNAGGAPRGADGLSGSNQVALADPATSPARPAAPALPGGFEGRFLAALAEALLPEAAEGGAVTVPEAADFLSGQRRALPHLLPRALMLASLGADLSTLATRGRRFHRLPLDRRRQVVRAWRAARIGPFRTFLKFHEVFVAYLRHERLAVEPAP